MNLKEYAEQEGITLKEAKERTGLTHWKQEVVETYSPESCDEIPEIPESEDISDLVVETESKQEDLELIELSIRGAGEKSPHWNKRHLIGR